VYTIHKELVTLLQDESLEVIYFYWNFLLLVTLRQIILMFNNSAIRQYSNCLKRSTAFTSVSQMLHKDASLLWIKRRKIGRCLNLVNPHWIY